MFPIFKDSVIYLVSIYGSNLFSFIYRILIARMLGPSNFGLWGALSLILLYGNFLDLGLNYALVKEVSFYRGRGDKIAVEEIRNTVFTFIVIFSAIVSTLILISSIFFKKYGNNVSMAIAVIAVILLLKQIKNCVLSYFAADKDFKAIGLLIVSLTSLVGIFSFTMVLKFNFIGLPLGIALGYFLVLSYFINKYELTFRLQMNIKRLFTLVKVGFPIEMIFAIYMLFFTVDRMLIFKYLGKESLGYYGTVSGLSGLLLLFPISLGVVIFPRLSEQHGSQEKPEKLKELVCASTRLIAYVMPFLLGAIYLSLPSVVGIVAPQYLPGVNAGRIVLLGLMFFSLSVFAQKLLIAINRQIYCMVIVLFALLLRILLIYIFIKRNLGIEGVAMAVNIVYFIYSTSIILLASYYCKNKFLESLRYFVAIYLPFIYTALVFVVVNYIKPLYSANAGNEIVNVLIQLVLFTILVLASFGYTFKKRLHLILKKGQWKN